MSRTLAHLIHIEQDLFKIVCAAPILVGFKFTDKMLPANGTGKPGPQGQLLNGNI